MIKLNNMKYWKKGAIIGARWGFLVGPLIFLLFSFIFYDVVPSSLLKNIVFTPIFFPSVVIESLCKLFSFQYTFENNYELFFYNFIGWIIIGAVIGYLIGRLRKR